MTPTPTRADTHRALHAPGLEIHGAASDPSPAPSAPAPHALRLIAAAPLTVIRFYLRWCVLAPLLARRRDTARAARQWARWDRLLRPAAEDDVMAQLDFWTYVLARRAARGRMAVFLFTLPGMAMARAIRAVRVFGLGVRREHGVPRRLQALEIWRLQLRFPLAFAHEPKLYYTHEIFGARRADAPFLFGTLHQNLLAQAVNGATAGVMDKRDFARRCAAEGLAHVPSVAEIGADGEVTWPPGTGALPREDLFSKPARDANGTGAARWIREADGRYRAESGAVLDAEAVIRELQAAAARGPIVVQRRLHNHPEVESLVGATVATVRFASLLHADGRFEPLLAIHRSARSDSAVDNSAKGGIASPVDLGSGVLGAAVSVGEAGARFSDTHPRTGAAVTGAQLPFWAETTMLVERAHRAFAECPLIGWDVAITGDGPVLIEANIIWNARSLQAAHRVALGRLPVAGRLLELLERRCGGSVRA